MSEVDRLGLIERLPEHHCDYCGVDGYDTVCAHCCVELLLAQRQQLQGAVDAYRDIIAWARATFDLAGRPDYGDGIDRLLERHGLEPLPPYRPHDRRKQ